MHRKQVTGVAAHDHIRPTGGSQRQVLVVLWIAALPYRLSRLDPLGRNGDNVENPLTPSEMPNSQDPKPVFMSGTPGLHRGTRDFSALCQKAVDGQWS